MNDTRARTLQTLAPRLAARALANVEQEFPHAPAHVVERPDDRRLPRELHPVFHGAFDWHSAVHMHWLLVRLLRRCPDQVDAGAVRRCLDGRLAPEPVRTEADYLREHPGFERPYGWAWLWALAAECRAAGPVGRAWTEALQPAVDVVADLLTDWLPRRGRPVRDGTHGNDAFALGLLHDAAPVLDRQDVGRLVEGRAMRCYAGDRDAPARWEPSGHDFLSPALAEADLVRRLLPSAGFTRWWRAFLPDVPDALRAPVGIPSAGDGQVGHLHGLDFHRAAAFTSIAAALDDAPAADALRELAARHLAAALPALDDDDFTLTHWLPTFAVMALDVPDGVPDGVMDGVTAGR